jgi:sulfur carrier protein
MADGRSPAATTAEILLNGKPRRVATGQSLERLLGELALDPRWVVAEINGEPVSRDRFAGTLLAAGDRVELVRPVAGG